MVVRSSMFRRISGFNEALVTGEDAELCERVIAAGGTIYESHHVMLVHLRNMNSIRGFFQKQAWHALGMFGSTRGWKLDRVSQLMFAHLTFTVAAVLWVLFGVGPLAMRALVGLALLLFVPLFAVTYRIVVRGGDAVVLRGLVLYEVYFYARIWSLFRLAVGARLG